MLWATTGEVKDKPDVPPSRRKQLLALSIAIGLLTILGPALLIPECCTGQPTPSGMCIPGSLDALCALVMCKIDYADMLESHRKHLHECAPIC